VVSMFIAKDPVTSPLHNTSVGATVNEGGSAGVTIMVFVII